MAKAVNSYRKFTMDFTSEIQYALSESGKVFRRSQYRDPRYGYKWGKWTEASAMSIEGLTALGPKKWRLPA